MSTEPAAKFFVNSGVVSTRVDIYHLLRPLLKQTVAYRYQRGASVIAHGTGWVERIVADRPDVSSFFTPLSICVNVDSWEHLEFETRPDQLLTYTLVQGDERVVLEFAPVSRMGEDLPIQQRLRLDGSPVYVQMELAGMSHDDVLDTAGDEGGEPADESG